MYTGRRREDARCTQSLICKRLSLIVSVAEFEVLPDCSLFISGLPGFCVNRRRRERDLGTAPGYRNAGLQPDEDWAKTGFARMLGFAEAR